MTSLRRTITVLAVLGCTAAGLEAQTRSELVDQARAEVVGSQPALNLLLSAANPANVALDSLWAVAVYDLADNLINVGESDLAAVWLRWVARHGADWPIDRTWYSQIVIDAFDIAAPAVVSGVAAGGTAVGTTWRWPGQFNPDAGGTLEVGGQLVDGLTVNVQGRGPVTQGRALNLPPGTYTISASAPGFDGIQVSREVLPGASTVLSFDLPPQLPSSVRSDIGESLVQISFISGGTRVCTNGVIVDSDGLVLTTLSGLGSATSVEVVTPSGSFSNVNVGSTDAARDLAVLRGPRELGPVPSRSRSVQEGQYAWSIYRQGCGSATDARTRLTGWPDQPRSAVALASPFPGDGAGAPVVDRAGAWLGLVMQAGSVLPIGLADELLEEARRALVAELQSAGEGGGGVPMWLLVAGGLGAAGAGAAVLLGGGSTPTPDPTPQPTTGSITLIFPGG